MWLKNELDTIYDLLELRLIARIRLKIFEHMNAKANVCFMKKVQFEKCMKYVKVRMDRDEEETIEKVSTIISQKTQIRVL